MKQISFAPSVKTYLNCRDIGVVELVDTWAGCPAVFYVGVVEHGIVIPTLPCSKIKITITFFTDAIFLFSGGLVSLAFVISLKIENLFHN